MRRTRSTQSTLAATQATKTIPIVFTGVGDPVTSGFVTNLACPGGTKKARKAGRTQRASDVYGKRVETCPFALPFNRCSTAGAIGPTSFTA